MNDNELKQLLAKMLPDKLGIKYGGLVWYPDTQSENDVIDTELLHLCQLIERNHLTADEHQAFAKLVKVSATWQQRVTALAKLAESEAHAKRLQDKLAEVQAGKSDALISAVERIAALEAELTAALKERDDLGKALTRVLGRETDLTAQLTASQQREAALAAVTSERDALKAKLATINHIAMSLFVRSTSSEVTGEMSEIGRLSREDGQ
jgi:hypothetical protein